MQDIKSETLKNQKTINSEINKSLKSDSFFDQNSSFYGNVTNSYSYDDFFINYIINRKKKYQTFLDIGGGSGFFSSLLKSKCDDMEITLIDPSQKMLEKNHDNTIIKYLGSLPDNIQILDGKKYDYILIKEVLHHITDRSIHDTKKKCLNSLKKSKYLLNDDGYLMIHEIFYESYLCPLFSRSAIFYLVKLQNRIGFSFLPKEFLLGLNVCFYTRSELEGLFQKCGFVIINKYKVDWPNTYKKKLLLLKNWGRILYILQKPL